MNEKAIAKTVCEILQSFGFQAVFAGGCVRDSLLGVKCNDYDIATNATPEQTIPILQSRGFSTKVVGESFAVILAKLYDYEFEIASFRKDIGSNGRHPESVEFATMEEDAARRDFTMNAVFFDPITEKFHDFVGGMFDIENKIIRFVGNAEDRIKEDYLRILRYFRFKAQLKFNPVSDDIAALNKFDGNITDFVSPERIRMELVDKVFARNISYRFLKEMFKYPHIFKNVLPEVYALDGVGQNPEYHPEGDAFAHTMNVVKHLDEMKAGYKSIVAGLFHDLGKASTTILEEDGKLHSKGHEKVSYELTRSIMNRLCFSNDEIDYVSGIVVNHMKLHYIGMKKSSLRKLMAESFFNDLVIQTKADCLGSNGDVSEYDYYIERIKTLEALHTRVLPKPFVDGSTLIKMGMKPSPLFKTILSTIMDKQLEGEINSVEEGIAEVNIFLGVV